MAADTSGVSLLRLLDEDEVEGSGPHGGSGKV